MKIKPDHCASFFHILWDHLNHIVENYTKFLNEPLVQKWSRKVITIVWVLLLGLILVGAWKYRASIEPLIKSANYSYFLISAIFFLLSIGFAVISWSFIMRQFAPTLKTWTHVYIFCTSLAARRLPGTIWYIGGRLSLYKHWGISSIKTSIASTIEIIVNLISGSITGLFFIIIGVKLSLPLVILLMICLGFGLIFLHPQFLTRLLIKLHHPLEDPLSFKVILTWIVPYMLNWISGGLIYYFIISAFSPLNFKTLFFILGAWAVSGVASILTTFLPSSFGVAEITMAAFISTLMPLPLAFGIAITFRFFTAIIEVILSFVFFHFFKDYTPKPDEIEIN